MIVSPVSEDMYVWEKPCHVEIKTRPEDM